MQPLLIHIITETEMIGETFQLEAVKDGQGIVVGVYFDQDTGKSTGVSAIPVSRETVVAGTGHGEKAKRTSEDKQVSSETEPQAKAEQQEEHK